MKASGYERWADDWYQEDAACVDALLAVERFDGLVWDPACGEGNIPKRCLAAGIPAVGSDLVDRGYGRRSDFLTMEPADMAAHIICNPPYGVIETWIERALAEGRTVERRSLAGAVERKKAPEGAFPDENAPVRAAAG